MKLVVIGGVAGGASAAARVRRLDPHAKIVVLERGEHVSFSNCALPYHLGGVVPDADSLVLMTRRASGASTTSRSGPGARPSPSTARPIP